MKIFIDRLNKDKLFPEERKKIEEEMELLTN